MMILKCYRRIFHLYLALAGGVSGWGCLLQSKAAEGVTTLQELRPPFTWQLCTNCFVFVAALVK